MAGGVCSAGGEPNTAVACRIEYRLRYLLRRECRLADQERINLLCRSREKRVDRALFIRFLDNGLDHPRLVISVRRRDYPRAVDRNRIKRLIREIFRNRSHELAGRDYMINVRPMKESLGYEEIDRRIVRLLSL